MTTTWGLSQVCTRASTSEGELTQHVCKIKVKTHKIIHDKTTLGRPANLAAVGRDTRAPHATWRSHRHADVRSRTMTTAPLQRPPTHLPPGATSTAATKATEDQRHMHESQNMARKRKDSFQYDAICKDSRKDKAAGTESWGGGLPGAGGGGRTRETLYGRQTVAILCHCDRGSGLIPTTRLITLGTGLVYCIEMVD